jgi:hypothetical protein
MKGRADEAMFSVRLPRELRDGLRAAARRNGITIEEYVTTVFAGRSFATPAARIAKPLANVNYRLTRITDALMSSDVEVARNETREAQRVVAEHLRPLRREHDRDVASMEQTKAGDWERG